MELKGAERGRTRRFIFPFWEVSKSNNRLIGLRFNRVESPSPIFNWKLSCSSSQYSLHLDLCFWIWIKISPTISLKVPLISCTPRNILCAWKSSQYSFHLLICKDAVSVSDSFKKKGSRWVEWINEESQWTRLKEDFRFIFSSLFENKWGALESTYLRQEEEDSASLYLLWLFLSHDLNKRKHYLLVFWISDYYFRTWAVSLWFIRLLIESMNKAQCNMSWGAFETISILWD